MIIDPAAYERIAHQLASLYLTYEDERLLARSRGVEPHRSGKVSAAWRDLLTACTMIAAALDTTAYHVRSLVLSLAQREYPSPYSPKGRVDWISMMTGPLAHELETMTEGAQTGGANAPPPRGRRQ